MKVQLIAAQLILIARAVADECVNFAHAQCMHCVCTMKFGRAVLPFVADLHNLSLEVCTFVSPICIARAKKASVAYSCGAEELMAQFEMSALHGKKLGLATKISEKVKTRANLATNRMRLGPSEELGSHRQKPSMQCANHRISGDPSLVMWQSRPDGSTTLRRHKALAGTYSDGLAYVPLAEAMPKRARAKFVPRARDCQVCTGRKIWIKYVEKDDALYFAAPRCRESS